MSAPWPEARVGNAEFTQAAVLIIGGGISGMCVGIDLLKRGISNFIIVEKSAGIGGTWRDNKYPGCACDGEPMFHLSRSKASGLRTYYQLLCIAHRQLVQCGICSQDLVLSWCPVPFELC